MVKATIRRVADAPRRGSSSASRAASLASSSGERGGLSGPSPRSSPITSRLAFAFGPRFAMVDPFGQMFGRFDQNGDQRTTVDVPWNFLHELDQRHGEFHIADIDETFLSFDRRLDHDRQPD